ncbi:antibiotic biosynthesis monooxygenase family protein [Micromonospora sp. NBRC 101691]|uniref:antibiotic biosynthesis monooxygenase family protein n=1 Tax=Micromonospora sp. NBRC 101691 TaxID=3032198 RepID=UPI0024A0CB68|nr:antibiotic biosynthesis monooxygenase family protein [Micromonospora sp. NBRC 101691]GLY20731.1 antibiotic biosynthesis monooxygenase [Micromonospora sp. NBRC 101691]
MSITPQTVISTDADLVTLINVFTVAPGRQAELVAALDRTTRVFFATVPGFRSANVHASQDGTRVVNYAQWASAGHFEAMLRMPEARPHLAEIGALVEQSDPKLYEVRSTHHGVP